MCLPLELLWGEVATLFSGQVEESMPGTRMEESTARLPEHEAQLVVVVGHEGRLRGLLGQTDQTVDVLNRLEGFLHHAQQTHSLTASCTTHNKLTHQLLPAPRTTNSLTNCFLHHAQQTHSITASCTTHNKLSHKLLPAPRTTNSLTNCFLHHTQQTQSLTVSCTTHNKLSH